MNTQFIKRNILKTIFEADSLTQKHLLGILVGLVAGVKDGDWPELLPGIGNLLKGSSKDEIIIGLKGTLSVFKAINLRLRKRDKLTHEAAHMLLPFVEVIAAKQIKTGEYSDLTIPSLLVKIYNQSNRFDLNEYL